MHVVPQVAERSPKSGRNSMITEPPAQQECHCAAAAAYGAKGEHSARFSNTAELQVTQGTAAHGALGSSHAVQGSSHPAPEQGARHTHTHAAACAPRWVRKGSTAAPAAIQRRFESDFRPRVLAVVAPPPPPPPHTKHGHRFRADSRSTRRDNADGKKYKSPSVLL